MEVYVSLKFKTMKAKEICEYLLIYREYLRDNDLTDDSDEISAIDLENFVDNHIECDYYYELKERISETP